MRYIVGILLLLPIFCYADKEIEYFSGHSDYQNIKISPDGKTLAVKSHQKKRNSITFIDVETLKPTGAINVRQGDDIYSYRWVNNDRIIYKPAKKTARYDRPIAYGQVKAINKDLSRRRIVYGFGASRSKTGSLVNSGAKSERKASVEILSTLEAEPDYILIAEYPWTLKGNTYYDARNKPVIISRLNVYTGRIKNLETLRYPGARPLANKAGEIEFLSYTDKNNIDHVYRRSPENKDLWQPLELSGLGDETRLLGINRDGSEVYLTTRWHSEGRSSLLTLQTKNLQLSPIFPDVNGVIDDWVVEHRSGVPAVAVSEPDKFSYHYHGQGLTVKHHKMLARAFKGKRVEFISRSRGGEQIIVAVSSATTPSDYYLFNTHSKEARYLMSRQSWINPDLMQPVEPIEFKARDGQLIRGYFTRAKGKDKAPLVVIPHGGPHGVRDYWTFDQEAQMLAYKGFHVLQINFRGSGGYGLAFEQLGYRQWGGDMINDIIDGTQFVLAQGKVADNKACIYGASYGGFAALMSVAKAPDLYKCSIGYVGVYDLAMMFTTGDIPIMNRGLGYLTHVLGSDAQSHRVNSPVSQAANIKAKVLLIPGEEDERAPIEQSEAMRAALIKAGNTPEWLEFGSAGHGVYDEKDRVKLYSEIIAFLNKNLGS